MILLSILDLLPWAQIGAMFGAWTAIIIFIGVIGSRWRPVARWIGHPIKDALGIPDLHDKVDKIALAQNGAICTLADMRLDLVKLNKHQLEMNGAVAAHFAEDTRRFDALEKEKKS